MVKGLWDSWEEDAFPFDKRSGRFFDETRMHVLDHKGTYLKVRGPLNIARPVQGWPVVVQAGAAHFGALDVLPDILRWLCTYRSADRDLVKHQRSAAGQGL